MTLERGRLGYRIDLERPAQLDARGEDPKKAMKVYKEAFPTFNPNADPLSIVKILDQKNQGACQGHSLSLIFSICIYLMTSRYMSFSRAAAYYLSQRRDNIRGDNGSTLEGGQWVATEHGLCLEEFWKYPAQYDPREPPSLEYPFKLKTTKRFKSIQDMKDWLDAGLPIQTGLNWNGSCDQEVVDSYNNRPGGGHSTVFWQQDASGNVIMQNSWSPGWNGDGQNSWTWRSIETALANDWNTFIGYAPDGATFPDQPPV